MRISKLIGAASAILAFAAAAYGQPVKVQSGLVDGTVEDGLHVFRGIPYAAPPVGNLRWRAPQPVGPWTGVRSAKAFTPMCPQPSTPTIGLPTSEDCLYLNIWSPSTSSSDRLPVMVWIHGGGFAAGGIAESVYFGEQLAKRGVIVVTLDYRLGALGYLAHPALSAESGGRGSGTYGLMDMIAGLKWVRDNIKAFGGDPGRVTIFGESAGGIAVSMLAVAPQARGLFHRAISESGGSMAPAKTANEGSQNIPALSKAEADGAKFLEKLGVKSIAEARALPADEIVKATGASLGGFWPVMDGNILPGDSYSLYEAGRFNDTPILVGTNDDEGALFARSATASSWTSQINAQYGEKAADILKAYPGGDDTRTVRSARDLMRDGGFGWPTWAWARLQAKKGRGEAFVYYFTHVAPHPDIPLFKDAGAIHGSEIPYVFGHSGSGYTADDKRLSDMMMAYWTNFAKTGNPNGSGLPSWPAYSDGDPRAMRLNLSASAIPYPNLEQIKILDEYFLWRRSGK